MLIRALKTFAVWDGTQARVFNAGKNGEPGDAGELADHLALEKIEEGFAEEATEDAPTPKPAKAAAAASATDDAKDELKAAKREYRAAVGKNAGPSWDLATVRAKLAEHQAQAGGDAVDDDDAPAQ